MNPNITSKFIEKHMDKPWVWGQYGISSNPNITPEFIEKHMDKPWYWGLLGLSSNTFSKIIEYEKQNNAALIIQKGCHNWLWKPKCKDNTIGINVRNSLRELQIHR